jgi:uncharacterized membrane protein
MQIGRCFASKMKKYHEDFSSFGIVVLFINPLLAAGTGFSYFVSNHLVAAAAIPNCWFHLIDPFQICWRTPDVAISIGSWSLKFCIISVSHTN